jgi:hypothetical protein
MTVSRETLPTWLFGVFIAVAGPLLLFHFGAFHWFFRDDLSILADRHSGLPDLFAPYGDSHWIAVPRLLYVGLWQAFGLTTYRPYQLSAIVMHLTAVVLVHAVMRRAGVRPWLASAAAAGLVLFGPGAQNIVWAFQVGFTGSIAFGLAHLLLADHDGPTDRRDLLGLAFGLLAITSSGIGLTTTVAVAVAVLLRRGWRLALLHGVPLVLLYGIWAALAGASTASSFGAPSVSVLLSWVRSSFVGALVGLGHFSLVAWAYVLLLLLATGLAVRAWRRGELRDLGAVRTRLSMPTGLAIGALFFTATTGYGRWWLGNGSAGAQAERYVHLEAILVLPAIAVAAEAIAARWPVLVPALVALFLLPIPFNVDGFGDGPFGRDYMEARRATLTTAVRMPFARDVPRDVQPVPDPYASDAVTIGFLLSAEQAGRLNPSTTPLTPAVIDQFKVRLGVAQREGDGPPSGCRTHEAPLSIDPQPGDVLHLGSAVGIAPATAGQQSGAAVQFNPIAGTELTIELPDLHLVVVPAWLATSFELCEEG